MNKDETLEKPTNRWSLICKDTGARATTFYIYNTSLLNRPNVARCYVSAFVYVSLYNKIAYPENLQFLLKNIIV